MSGLSALFGNTAEKAVPDDERLLDLYWNRNELKKEFAGLRSEKFKLTDQIKTQQGDMARLQQKLEHLEQLLVEPEWSRSIMVMYRLRGLSDRCRSRIALFAEQIKQQQEQKQHGAAVARWRAGIKAETDALEQQIFLCQEQAAAASTGIERLQQKYSDMGRIMRLIRRRKIRDQIAGLNADIEQCGVQAQSLREQIRTAESQDPPEVMGLTLATKRTINFMILAYAQQLYLSFDDNALVGLAKEATDKSAGAVRYGSDDDCEDIIERIRRSGSRLASGKDSVAVLQKRAKMISEGAVYKNEDDAVPQSGSVATLFDINADGRVRTADANLLGQNYWDLPAVMSR